MGALPQRLERLANEARSFVGEKVFGESGILRLLREDHIRIIKLFEEAVEAKQSEEKMECYRRLRRELLAHAEAEEATFYLALSEVGEGRAMSESAEEHQMAVDLLMELDSLPLEQDAWSSLFQRLGEVVERHLRREERRVFPLAKEHFDSRHLEHLEREFVRVKQRALDTIADSDLGRFSRPTLPSTPPPSRGGLDKVDEASWESFPASDPPGY